MPALEALLGSRHDVAAVLTRPDAPAGRGLQLTPSPVALRAEQAGVEVLKPAKPGDPDFLARLRQIAPDCVPVTAYGALIGQQALDIPAHGWVNLHFSLLPAWRGAAPVQHAIRSGDDITGATTFRLVRELDAGPVYGVMTELIGPEDTAGELLDRLSVAGAGLLVATLDGIESGELTARPQSAEGVSYAPKLSTADARVDWKQPALSISRLIRACTPVPWSVDRAGRRPDEARPGHAGRARRGRPGRAAAGRAAAAARPGARRYRDRARAARGCAAHRQAGDAGGRLGPRIAAGGPSAGARLTWQPARNASAAGRRPGVAGTARIRPGARPATRCAR